MTQNNQKQAQYQTGTHAAAQQQQQLQQLKQAQEQIKHALK